MSVNFFVLEETLITKMWQAEEDGEDEQIDSNKKLVETFEKAARIFGSRMVSGQINSMLITDGKIDR